MLFLSIGSVYFLNTCIDCASERFTPNFPVVSLYFACLLALVASTTTAASFTKNLNRSQASRLRNHAVARRKSRLAHQCDEGVCKDHFRLDHSWDCPSKDKNSKLREAQLPAPAHRLLAGSSNPNLRLLYRALNYDPLVCVKRIRLT